MREAVTGWGEVRKGMRFVCVEWHVRARAVQGAKPIGFQAATGMDGLRIVRRERRR